MPVSLIVGRDEGYERVMCGRESYGLCGIRVQSVLLVPRQREVYKNVLRRSLGL